MSIVLDKEMEFKTVYCFYISFYAHMQAQAKQSTKIQNQQRNFCEVDWSKARMSKSFPPSFPFKTF